MIWICCNCRSHAWRSGTYTGPGLGADGLHFNIKATNKHTHVRANQGISLFLIPAGRHHHITHGGRGGGGGAPQSPHSSWA